MHLLSGGQLQQVKALQSGELQEGISQQLLVVCRLRALHQGLQAALVLQASPVRQLPQQKAAYVQPAAAQNVSWLVCAHLCTDSCRGVCLPDR